MTRPPRGPVRLDWDDAAPADLFDHIDPPGAPVTTSRTFDHPRASDLPAWFTRRADWDLSPRTLGTAYDVTDRHVWIADVLEAMGWTVVRGTWCLPADARLDGKPHPRAGETIHKATCTPPNYDQEADPVWHATAESVERYERGNTSHGRGAAPYVDGPTSPTTRPADLRATALRGVGR